MSGNRAFAKRLYKVQHIMRNDRREHQLRRLLARFQAETVCTSRGKIIGYRLPDGEWFCRKVEYHSQAEADIAAEVIRRRGRGCCYVYRCKTCGHWHLTSSNPNKKNSYGQRFNK